MSKLAIASRLADELGTTTAKAKKYVEDLGGSRANRVADDLSSSGSRSVGDFVTPGTLAVGGIGGGALLWRQQDVESARALAEQSSSYNEAVQSIMDSNLPPELKQDMVDDATQAAEDRNNGGDGGGSNSFIDGIFDDPMKMIFALVLMVVILQYALDGGIASSLPDGSGGAAA